MSFFSSFLSSFFKLRERERVYNGVQVETVLMFTYLFDRFLRRAFSLLLIDGILCIHKGLAWRHGYFSLSKILSAFFTRSLGRDSPPSVHGDLCSKTNFPYPYFRCRNWCNFHFRILAKHLSFFFLSLVTECKHLLAFTLTHILYFLRQAVRNWPILLFLFLAVSRNILFLFSQWETSWHCSSSHLSIPFGTVPSVPNTISQFHRYLSSLAGSKKLFLFSVSLCGLLGHKL